MRPPWGYQVPHGSCDGDVECTKVSSVTSISLDLHDLDARQEVEHFCASRDVALGLVAEKDLDPVATPWLHAAPDSHNGCADALQDMLGVPVACEACVPIHYGG